MTSITFSENFFYDNYVMRGENCETTYVIVGAILKRPTIKYYTCPNNVFVCSFLYDFLTGKPNRFFTVINILKSVFETFVNNSLSRSRG